MCLGIYAKPLRLALLPRSGHVPKPRVAVSATLGIGPVNNSTATRLRLSGRNPYRVGSLVHGAPRVEAILGFET